MTARLVRRRLKQSQRPCGVFKLSALVVVPLMVAIVRTWSRPAERVPRRQENRHLKQWRRGWLSRIEVTIFGVGDVASLPVRGLPMCPEIAICDGC